MDNRLLRPRARLQWLLRDEFHTALAAGSVNATAAEPGPGTRVVVDTGVVLSIAGGLATVATATGSADPRLTYGTYARVAGRIAVFLTSKSDNLTYLGWDEATTGIPSKGSLYKSDTSILVYDGAARAVGVIVDNVEYYVASIVRTAGVYVFIKGGIYTNWSLLWAGSSTTDDPLYLVHAWRSDAASVSAIRVPDALWLPQPELSDGFAAANGTLLNTLSSDGLGHAEGVTTGIGAGGSGQSWSLAPDTYTIQTNKAINTPVAGADLLAAKNGDMADWTADVLDIWTNTGESGADPEIAEVATGEAHADAGTPGGGFCNIYTSDGTLVQISQTLLTAQTWYMSSVNMDTVTAGGLLVAFNGQVAIVMDATGTTIRTGWADGTAFALKRNAGATDITFDDVSVKALTLSDLLALQLRSTQDGIMDADLVVVKGTQAGVAMNWDSDSSPANGVIAFHDGVNARLHKCVAGTWTSVISAAATYSANAKIRVIKSGTTYSLFYNGAAVGAASTISDAGIISNKYHGLFNTYVSNTINDAIFRPRGTSGEYAHLDRYIKG